MLPDHTAHYILNCLYSKARLPVEMTNLLAFLFLVAICEKEENCSQVIARLVLQCFVVKYKPTRIQFTEERDNEELQCLDYLPSAGCSNNT